MDKPSYSQLLLQLQNTTRELERLRYLHLPLYAGKVGEPDKVIIDLANKTIISALKEV